MASIQEIAKILEDTIPFLSNVDFTNKELLADELYDMLKSDLGSISKIQMKIVLFDVLKKIEKNENLKKNDNIIINEKKCDNEHEWFKKSEDMYSSFKNGDIMIARDISIKSGAKQFCVMKMNELENFIDQQNIKNYYEFFGTQNKIGRKIPCKLYLDYDFKGVMKNEQFLRMITFNCIEFFDEHFNIELKEEDFCIENGSYENVEDKSKNVLQSKTSFHIKLVGYHFSSYDYLLKLVKSEKFQNSIFSISDVDQKPYNDVQSFRLANCSKLSIGVPLKIVSNHTFKDSLITHIDSNSILIPDEKIDALYPQKQSSNKKESKKYESIKLVNQMNINNHDSPDPNNIVLEMIESNHPFFIYISGDTDSDTWFKMCCFLYNGGVSKDNLNNISKIVPDNYNNEAQCRIKSIDEKRRTTYKAKKVYYFLNEIKNMDNLSDMKNLYEKVSSVNFNLQFETIDVNFESDTAFCPNKCVNIFKAHTIWIEDDEGKSIPDYKNSKIITSEYIKKFFFLFRNRSGYLLERKNGKVHYERSKDLIKFEYNKYVLYWTLKGFNPQPVSIADLIFDQIIFESFESIVMEPDMTKFDVIKIEGIPHFNSWHGFRAVNMLEALGEPIYHNINIEDALNIFYNQEAVIQESPGLMMILNHFRHIMCSDIKEQYTELLLHIASMIQFPKRQLPVCIFKSEQGIGKNLLFEQLLGDMILGDEYSVCTEKLDLAVGRFNSILENKTFLILDETSTFIGDHGVNNLLKSLATQKTINIEKKGMDSYKVPSYINKMIFTNNEAPIRIDESDRRYNMYDVNNKIISDFMSIPDFIRRDFNDKKEYFSKMAEYVSDNNTVLAVTRFFCSIDVRNYKPSLFKSTVKSELRDMSKTPFELFCEALEDKSSYDGIRTLEEYYISDQKLILISEMHEEYTKFCNDCGLKRYENQQVFTTKFMKHFKMTRTRLRRGGERNSYFCPIDNQNSN